MVKIFYLVLFVVEYYDNTHIEKFRKVLAFQKYISYNYENDFVNLVFATILRKHQSLIVL